MNTSVINASTFTEVPHVANPGVFTSPTWCRALTFAERNQLVLRNDQVLNGSVDGAGARRRIERWKGQYPFDRKQYFAFLLDKKGISQEALEASLGVAHERLVTFAEPVPDWLNELRTAYSHPTSQPFEPPEGQEELGFLNLVDPLLEQALYHFWEGLDRLHERYASLPFDPETIEDVVLMNLPEPIIQRLGRTLVLELNVLRLEDQLEGENGHERFLHFVRKLREPDYVNALYDEYPVLARQLSITIKQWLAVNLEFLERLCADWELLKSTFSDGADPGPLVRLAGGAGDTHRRGRSVMIAEFESGLGVVYKPKSLAIDIHFQELVDWLNENGCEPRLRNFITLDRIDYGWAELVGRADCSTEEEVRRFYRRQGIYLALLHVLASTDFHFENVIAAGEHPMLIDLETMLQPRFERYDESSAESMAVRNMAESVLAIGLLPMRIWSYGDDYQGIDISGLGGARGQLSPDRIPGLADQGTDAMRYVRQRVEIDGDANRPVLDGVELNAIDYIDEITAGFDHMYGLIMENREEFLRPGGLIDSFANDSIRVLMRPTRTYWQLLYESFHPDMLRDELDRDLFFDRLWLVVPERNYMMEIIGSEQDDLLHGDIPVFTTTPTSLDLYDASDRAIPGVLTERGIDNVRQRIAALTDEDRQRQLWYIRASISSVASKGGTEPYTSIPRDSQGRTLQPSRMLSTVREIADSLCEQAFETEEEVLWVGLESQGERYWSIATLGIDLYAGSPGIALFLAYAGEVLAEPKYRDVARKAYVTIQKQSESAADNWSSIGGYEGWGGILYLFTHLGALWSDEAILDEAARIANRIWGYIDEDAAYDVVRGSAGAIQALLALHAVRPSDTLVRLATLCGEHLLDAAQQQVVGVGWVPSRFGDNALTGYGHGAAGIAAALLRLHSVTGQQKFRDCALASLRYERSVLDPAAGNWPDLHAQSSYDQPQTYDKDGHMSAWCRGSAGIGLGRLDLFDDLADEELVAEIDLALSTTLDHGFGHTHCLCHGDMGNLELLLTAANHARWRSMGDHVDRLSRILVADIHNGGWKCGGPGGVFMPGLMVGVAGIGYELLRLVRPQAVPSVLTLAPPAAPASEQPILSESSMA